METLKERYGFCSPFELKEVREKIKKKNLEKFGVENPFSNREIQEKAKKTVKENNDGLGASSKKIKEKMKQTMIDKYGVDHNFKLKEEQEKAHSKESIEKIKRTNLERFGCECSVNNEEIQEKIKKNNLEKFGVEFSFQRKDVIEKREATKRKNHTFNVSKPEEEIFLRLKEKFGEENVLRQFKSEVYPFNCDFYIKSLDLYIELNFHWTHGKYKFDPLNEEDQKKKNLWISKGTKFYFNAVKTWTKRDLKKFKIAKENHLNYLVFYGQNDFDQWIKNS